MSYLASDSNFAKYASTIIKNAVRRLIIGDSLTLLSAYLVTDEDENAL